MDLRQIFVIQFVAVVIIGGGLAQVYHHGFHPQVPAYAYPTFWFYPKLTAEKSFLTKTAVQSRPNGVNVYDARKELIEIQNKNLEQAGKKIVCYFSGWAIYRKDPMKFDAQHVDTSRCTHLMYAFAGLDNSTYEITSLDPERDIDQNGYKNAVDLKADNPDLKVMIAIGGWAEGVKKYSQMAATKERRANFVSSVVKFIEKYNFDGLDVDWEYPGDTERGGGWNDMSNYADLLDELREAFNPKGWLLSAAVPAPQSRIDQGYDVKRISAALDFINVMTYDLHGSWDGYADHHAPLYKRSHDSYPVLTVDAAMKYWHQKGAPKEKLIMGVPFYGRSFVLKNAQNSNPGEQAPAEQEGFQGEYTEENGFLSYFEICSLEKQPGWVKKQDDTGNAYLVNGKKIVGYDTPEAIERKMNYVRANSYGGGMIWAIDLDDFNGDCGEKGALLKTMHTTLNSNKAVPENEQDFSSTEGVEQSSSSEENLYDCSSPGIFASPHNCNSYYQCSPDGTSYEHKCPEGLHFNSVSKICDWPANVVCGQNVEENSYNLCSQKSDGIYADPRDCSKMVTCKAFKLYQSSCPPGLYFDPIFGTCHQLAFYRCLTYQIGQPTFYKVPIVKNKGSVAFYGNKPSVRLNAQAYNAKGDGKNVICYFTNWATFRKGSAKFVPENVDSRPCSHIFYAYAKLDSATFEAVPGEPTVDINDGYLSRIIQVGKARNPSVKIMLALGGWTDSGGDKYSRLVNDPVKRSNFVAKVVEMLQIRNFDGLSIDWQYPVCWQSDCSAGPKSDKEAFASLIKELKQAFEPKGLILAAGLSGYSEIAKDAYDFDTLSKNLDMVSIFTYDYHGFWDQSTSHHSPLKNPPGSKDSTYNSEYALEFYVSNGFSKSQLNMGIPFYGQSYTLASNSNNGVGAQVSGPGNPGEFSLQPGMLTYFEICKQVKTNSWSSTFDASYGDFASSGNQWVSYNDISSVEEKAKYIESNGYAGVAIWTLDMDDFNNDCCYGPNPLLSTLGYHLRNVGELPKQNCDKPLAISTPAPPESTTGFDDGGAFENTSPSTTPKATTIATTTIATTVASVSMTAKPSKPSKPGKGEGKKCNEEGKTFSHPDCSKYYRCVNKKKIILTCTVGLLWNNVRGQCDWANQVICGKRTVSTEIETGDSAAEEEVEDLPSTPSSLVEEVPESCSPGEYLPAPGECGAYFACSNGTPQKSYCSQGLHWNQDTLSCNWASLSECIDDPDTQSIFYQEGQACSGSEGFLPHPDDCSSYLICLQNTFVTFKCPPGLHWDAKTSVCNEPEKAECSNEGVI